jgi:peptidoglycan-N-acetylglucosamine deacetylase
MNPLRQTYKLRRLIPRAARERLYEWHPGRAARWQRYPGIERVPRGGRAVLTFDDGPDVDSTPAILDALDLTGARATFFVLGSQVDAHLDIAHEIVRRGHEVGLHGYGHERQDRIDPGRSRDDVLRARAAVEDAIGVRCQWYRPPFGKMSAAAAEACRGAGLATVYWSAWGLDWENVPARRIAEVAGEQIDDGGIVLLHDSALYGHRPSAIPTAEAIAPIAECAKARGLALISLGDSLASLSPIVGDTAETR